MPEIRQPIAWEPLAELREFVALRPYMQLPQWQAEFCKFSSYSFEDLVDADIRSRMFDQLTVDGLIHHYYATELDELKKHNSAWKSKAGDIPFICSAFPICSINLHHIPSILCRRGYEDKNGRRVPPSSARTHFRHKQTLGEAEKKAHKEEQKQILHKHAIDTLLGYLCASDGGLEIVDCCPECKQSFTALNITDKLQYHAEYVDNLAKFKYDIAGVDQNGDLSLIIEILNTHKMGTHKRDLAQKICEWIEISAEKIIKAQPFEVNSNNRILTIDALKFSVTHSRPRHCPRCAVIVAEKEEVERRQASLREKIRRSESDLQGLTAEASLQGQRFEQFCESLCELQIGFSTASLAQAENALNRIEDNIREAVTKLDSIQSRIEGMNLDETQLEIETEERKTSLCSVTGLSMESEFEARALPALQLAQRVLQEARNKRVTCDETLKARRAEIDDMRISIKDLEEIAEW